MTAGQEFGAELQGQPVLIIQALYGLKSSGAAWRAHLAQTLRSFGFDSSLADPGIWLQPACKPNGFKYYELCSFMLMAFLFSLIILQSS